MKRKYGLIILWLFRINADFIPGQNIKIDSLQYILKTTRLDTARYNVFMAMGNYFKNSDPDTALYYYSKAEITAEYFPDIERDLKKSEALGKKGWCFFLKGDYANATHYYEFSNKIIEKYLNSEEKNFNEQAKRLHAANLGNIGSILLNTGDYARAMEFYLKALNIYNQIGNKQGQIGVFNNLGNVYHRQGEYNRALEYYFMALKNNEEIGNKLGLAINLGNIGSIYSEQGDFVRSLEYYYKALNINEEIDNKFGQAENLSNIGTEFYKKGDLSRALEYYFKSLNLYEKLKDKVSMARNLSNIGNIYFDLGETTRSLDFFLKAQKLDEETNNKLGQAANFANIGVLYNKQKKYHEAEAYLKKAEQMFRDIHTIYHLMDACSELSELYEQTGRYKDALHYYKEYIKARDTVLSEENRKSAILKDMKYKYEKEQALKEQEHQKQLAIEKEKQEKQKITTRFIIAGLILVLLFSGFIVNRLHVTRRQKKIIENQKQIVEEQKKVVEEQKLVVEQKNKDITDSIKYAKRIQDAILPHPQKWKQFLPDSFILYLPKDIVAGDFYWMEVLDDYVYVAAADCTGHGVPGAMVSVVCSNALTKAVLEEKILNTDDILNRVREIVIEKLTSEENIRDGMDICLIRLTKNSDVLQYSGANRPLYVVSPVAEYGTQGSRQAGTEATGEGGGPDTLRYSTTDENQPVAEYVTGDGVQAGTDATGIKLIELKPDKQPIGRYEKSKVFTKQEIVLQKNSMLYLCTDGFADQFGGEKGKKIGTKAFKELLKEKASIKDCEQQREHLVSYFQQWKSNEEQMDDVTIIGISN